ncbi:hypothetical protein ACJX0J_007971, partial [Zea mays]
CECFDLHRRLVPYAEAYCWQKSIVERRKRLIDSGEDHSDTLIALQHPPVYTLGTDSKEEYLHFDKEDAPFEVHRINRGGEVTYHGPGQLVIVEGLTGVWVGNFWNGFPSVVFPYAFHVAHADIVLMLIKLRFRYNNGWHLTKNHYTGRLYIFAFDETEILGFGLIGARWDPGHTKTFLCFQTIIPLLKIQSENLSDTRITRVAQQ